MRWEQIRFKVKRAYENYIFWCHKQWVIDIRRFIWIIMGGWLLWLEYLLGYCFIVVSFIFLYFRNEALKYAWYAFDPVVQEPYAEKPSYQRTFEGDPLNNPNHYFTIFVNCYWCCTVGWLIALTHALLAILNIITVIGVENAVIHIEMIRFSLFPFGSQLKPRTFLRSRNDVPAPRIPIKSLYSQTSMVTFKSDE